MIGKTGIEIHMITIGSKRFYSFKKKTKYLKTPRINCLFVTCYLDIDYNFRIGSVKKMLCSMADGCLHRQHYTVYMFGVSFPQYPQYLHRFSYN